MEPEAASRHRSKWSGTVMFDIKSGGNGEQPVVAKGAADASTLRARFAQQQHQRPHVQHQHE